MRKLRYVTLADGDTGYVTIDGDMVDEIAHAFYGEHKGKTELLYEANPGLAARGLVLPAGVVIRLPRVTKELTPQPITRLWD